MSKLIQSKASSKLSKPSKTESKSDLDAINPEHYKKGGKQVWQMMIDIWGKDSYIAFCEMNAFKYRMRAGNKPGNSTEQDMEKAKWYENQIQQLRDEQSKGNHLSDNL